MSVARVPAMTHTLGTVCRTQVGASAAFVVQASQVSTGEAAARGSCLCSRLVADPPAPACLGPRCQTVLSPCESQPCQHGGQCRPSPGPGGVLTFTCHCIPVGHTSVSGRGVGSVALSEDVALGETRWKGKGFLRNTGNTWRESGLGGGGAQWSLEAGPPGEGSGSPHLGPADSPECVRHGRHPGDTH